MFAVGHMALGYLLGKGSAAGLKLSLNVPAILVLSIIPDIDILFGVEEFHRGPTHSVVVAALIFIPLFVIYRKKAAPYFTALLSHSLIDLVVGGNLQLFWPITSSDISLPAPFPNIAITSSVNIALELTLFVVATIVMFKGRDLRSFLSGGKTNLLLLVPIATVLLPTFVAYPLTVPILLVLPHLFYLALFSISVFVVFLRMWNKRNVHGGKSLYRDARTIGD